MGTGWRRALCTSVRRDTTAGDSPSPRSCSKISFFSNASTPRGLRCRTKCEAAVEEKVVKKPVAVSAPCSPRSPSKFALFKASLLSRGRCGVCDQSVKSRSSGNMAVFTAECGHAFHFPCISSYMRSNPLSCPVCSAAWQQSPFVSTLRLHQPNSPLAPKPKHQHFDDNAENRTPRKEDSKPVSSNKKYKVYNDDEALLPKSRVNHGGFNPIPEANEESELEFESESGDANFGLSIGVSPEAALVSTGRKHGKYVVSIKVKAPPLAKSNHVRPAPVDLVTVLDVGQGMTGEKLQMLKRAVRLVIASLGPSDRLSLVAFSGTAAKRLLPLRRMSRQGQRSARSIVDRLVVAAGNAPGGVVSNACIGDALKKATKVLEDRRERNPVATIMLLSDRQQEMKKERDNTISQQIPTPKATTRFAHVEIPISEEPTTMETETTPRKEDAFVKCLGGLVSVVMQNVRLHLNFPSGEILSVYSCGAGQQPVALPIDSIGRGGRAIAVPLGDLYAEEEKELLLELRTPLQPQDHMSLSARWSYRDPTSRESICGPETPLLLPPLDCNSTAIHLRNLFVTTRALAESRRVVELMDFATAQRLLSSARSLLLQTQVQPQSGCSSLDKDHHIERLDSEMREVMSKRRETRQDPLTPPCQSLRMRSRDATVHVAAADALTPTSAWRAAEQLAKVAIMRKSLNRVSDLHGFENARF